MDKMGILKRYYNERLKIGDMPAFDQLTDDQKRQIENTLGFAGYQSGLAIAHFKDTVLKFVGIKGQ